MASLDERIADVFGLSSHVADQIQRFVLEARGSRRSAESTMDSKAA